MAEDIVRAFGDSDVLDHRAEDFLADRMRLRLLQPCEARLDVGRQNFQRAHIEVFADLFDFMCLELHGFDLCCALLERVQQEQDADRQRAGDAARDDARGPLAPAGALQHQDT